jgi:O-antigen ligase
MILTLIGLMQNEDFKESVLSKFTVNEEISSNGEYSRADRTNSALVGLRMALANPVLGVGISNYSRHYDHFNRDPRFITKIKSIPNNVFVEVLAETGILGLGLFLYLLYLLFRKTNLDESGILKYGLFATLIYFVAFPTFSILYIWGFFGLINSLHARNK